MMICYHGTPISPVEAFYQLAGRFFCVPHGRPDDVRKCHEIGSGVMLDNGAYSAWKRGRETNWAAYYRWTDRWLDFPQTWAVIPDVIGGSEADNDLLVHEWPHGHRGAPVWHMHDSVGRLLNLIDRFPRVCIGSSQRYAVVMSPAWQRRMDEVWNALATQFGRTPNIHMLRGMDCAGRRWPFGSVDSTDIARNHNRPGNSPKAMAERWDSMQTPGRWVPRPEQMELV